MTSRIACRIASLCLGIACCASLLAEAGKIPARDLSERCMFYGNVKTSSVKEEGASLLKLEYGKGDGVFGGAWFPINKPKLEGQPCRGIGLTVRGNGNRPGRAYLFIRTEKGSYRSKDIKESFVNTAWHDVILSANDFVVDPDAKKDAVKDLPKQPVWSDITRMDFSAVNLEAEPTLELKSVYFITGDLPDQARPDAKNDAKTEKVESKADKVEPKSDTKAAGSRVAFKDFSDKQCFSYANVKPSFGTDGADAVLKLSFGAGDGVFGGAWFPVSPGVAPADCRGVIVSVKGNGNRPGHAYMFLKNAKGGYRSKDLAPEFANTQWHDLVLSTADFVVDPSLKAEVKKDMPAQVDFSTINRWEFSAVNLESEPALELKSLAFFAGEVSSAAPAKAASPAKSADPRLNAQKNAGSDPLTPVAKDYTFPQGHWLERHDKFVARAKQGDVDLVWFGDSITDNWNQNKGTYRKLFPDVKDANFGLGGDGTQNLLWRLENGELDGMSPKVAVVLIGTNNVQWHPSQQISTAIERIVQTIRTKCPNTKVLLMGIFPRGDLATSSPGPQRIREVNSAISKLDDGRNVRYLDITDKLANPDGTIIADAFADKVHLSVKGFTIWAESIRPLLNEMMK